jgi:hypothetical protein
MDEGLLDVAIPTECMMISCGMHNVTRFFKAHPEQSSTMRVHVHVCTQYYTQEFRNYLSTFKLLGRTFLYPAKSTAGYK